MLERSAFGSGVSAGISAACLPPGLAAGMSHINEEIWSYQGKELARQQAVRNRGMGLSA